MAIHTRPSPECEGDTLKQITVGISFLPHPLPLDNPHPASRGGRVSRDRSSSPPPNRMSASAQLELLSVPFPRKPPPTHLLRWPYPPQSTLEPERPRCRLSDDLGFGRNSGLALRGQRHSIRGERTRRALAETWMTVVNALPKGG